MSYSEYPTVEDVKHRVESMGITVDSKLQRQIEICRDVAIENIEGAIRRKILGSASDPDVTRAYDPPINSEGLLFLRADLAQFTKMEYKPRTAVTATLFVRDVDFVLLPVNAAVDGQPWRKVQVYRDTFRAPFPPDLKGSLLVTGKWGMSLTSIPADLWSATLDVATMMAIVYPGVAVSGGVRRKRVEDFEVDYGQEGVYSNFIKSKSADVLAVVRQYNRIV